MTAAAPAATRTPRDFRVSRYHVDLTARTVRWEPAACDDLEDVLGGIARALKLLETRPVGDAYDPRATLILNLGIFSGSQFMTGLRTFFHAYSPLKTSHAGRPSAMWTAGSCKFGVKLRHLGVEEILFTGRAGLPTLLRIVPNTSGDATQGPAAFLFEDGADLRGRRVNDRIQTLHARFPHAHFAVTGPAGDHWDTVRFAAIALSSENQVASGDPKPRWCGRGGIGGVMGSKNLVAIACDVEDPPPQRQPAAMRAINQEVARGKGSARFRERRTGGGGGTWANYEALGPAGAIPEYNFQPSGTEASRVLWRDVVEAGPHVVKDESCWRCGIRCHKNVYDKGADGNAGRFRAKLDYEPLNLLSSNLGIFDVDAACDLVELVDEMGMDSISCGVTLAYAMEFNRRHASGGRSLAGGLSYGDPHAAALAIVALGEGRLAELGQGTKRLADATGETGYAMQSKGVEYPAYLPQTNPGYPWALAGGHMSMRTYLLLAFEKETGMDYWVDAITRRGPAAMRDDVLGICKFSAMQDAMVVDALAALHGLAVTPADLQRVVRRTYLRGYRIERRQGYSPADYAMPSDVHRANAAIQLPHFVTPEFFGELRDRVLAEFDRMAAEEGLAPEAET